MLTTGRDTTETAAITRADLSSFTATLDARSRMILELVTGGYTEREIAPLVGISNVMVHKLKIKIRTALADAVA